MLIVVGIGAGVIAGNAYLNGSPPAGTQIAIAAAALVVGGYLAGFIAQSVFSAMLDQEAIEFRCNSVETRRAYVECFASAFRPARAIAWMIAGSIAGAGIGAAFQSWVRIQNGVIGGAIGGLLGGLAFDSIPLAIDSDTSAVPQLVGITLIGTLIGLLIGLVDTARSDKWLEVLTGEMRGRQFLLLDRRATIGSARSNTVVLLADRQIKESHVEIIQNQNSISFNCLMSEPVELNGSVTTSGSLRDGDVLTIGATQVRFGLRRSSAAGAGPTMTASPSGPPTVRPAQHRLARRVHGPRRAKRSANPMVVNEAASSRRRRRRHRRQPLRARHRRRLVNVHACRPNHPRDRPDQLRPTLLIPFQPPRRRSHEHHRRTRDPALLHRL